LLTLLLLGAAARSQMVPDNSNLGSILQNSISAQNFANTFFIVRFWANVRQKTTGTNPTTCEFTYNFNASVVCTYMACAFFKVYRRPLMPF
jgi:hypothetical protein